MMAGESGINVSQNSSNSFDSGSRKNSSHKNQQTRNPMLITGEDYNDIKDKSQSNILVGETSMDSGNVATKRRRYKLILGQSKQTLNFLKQN
jgi:hypothetical protein